MLKKAFITQNRNQIQKNNNKNIQILFSKSVYKIINEGIYKLIINKERKEEWNYSETVGKGIGGGLVRGGGNWGGMIVSQSGISDNDCL